MRVLRTAALALFALATVPNSALSEAEQIGTATRIKTSVNGDYGLVEVSEPVHRNERITTSKSGLGEFLFRDGISSPSAGVRSSRSTTTSSMIPTQSETHY